MTRAQYATISPNTNIANNLGPQIDPKDIDYLEVQRGSYDADYGDRTYGVFNVVPRTGFERYRECDLVITAGNFYQTNDQISCGGHTQRFAYYASLNGNRSDDGLQTPIGDVVHDASNGFGGFASFIFNPDPQNQFRLVTQLRRDYYQIPIDPNPNSSGNLILEESGDSPSYGLRDSETEPDGYVTFSWVHTFNPNTLITVSPFYHYNGADYHGGADDCAGLRLCRNRRCPQAHHDLPRRLSVSAGARPCAGEGVVGRRTQPAVAR